MKKILFVISFVFPFFCFAQTDTTGTKQKEEYCMLFVSAKLFGKKINVNVDFGQEMPLLGNEKLRDGNGNVLNFNSIIAALNYMAKHGWLLVNAIPSELESGGTAFYYVMRRPIP